VPGSCGFQAFSRRRFLTPCPPFFCFEVITAFDFPRKRTLYAVISFCSLLRFPLLFSTLLSLKYFTPCVFWIRSVLFHKQVCFPSISLTTTPPFLPLSLFPSFPFFPFLLSPSLSLLLSSLSLQLFHSSLPSLSFLFSLSPTTSYLSPGRRLGKMTEPSLRKPLSPTTPLARPRPIKSPRFRPPVRKRLHSAGNPSNGLRPLDSLLFVICPMHCCFFAWISRLVICLFIFS